MAAIVPTLSSFTRAASRERLDGYVIAGPALESTELAADWAQAVLSALGDRADHGEGARPFDGELTFAFNGVLLSASVFPAPRPYILLRPRIIGDAGEHR